MEQLIQKLVKNEQVNLGKTFLEVFFQKSGVFKQFVLNIPIDAIHC